MHGLVVELRLKLNLVYEWAWASAHEMRELREVKVRNTDATCKAKLEHLKVIGKTSGHRSWSAESVSVETKKCRFSSLAAM